MTKTQPTLLTWIVRIAVVAVVAGLAVTVLTMSSSTDITKARLEADVAGSFGNYYRQHDRLVGVAEPRAVAAKASCLKGGPTVADKGPGRDWVCTVTYMAPDATTTSTSRYEVIARTEACYTATDPTLTAGHQFVTRRSDGAQADNPLYQFDGCFAVA